MYNFYDTMSYALHPSRKLAHIIKNTLNTSPNMLKYGNIRFINGVADMFERSTRIIKKPEFNIDNIDVDGQKVKILQTTVLKKPFGNLVKFKKENYDKKEPKVLIIAPISGHFATLLRDTVKRMCPKHEVYITDWISASEVPMQHGNFGLDAYLTYLIDFIRYIGPNTHVMAVCQPAVQVMALAAIMAEMNDVCTPASIIPMGGPIDPRANKTEVNILAESHKLSWFEKKLFNICSQWASRSW